METTGTHSIDIAKERVIALADVPMYLPHRRGGKRVAAATIHRWSRKGLYGIRLDTIQIAGTRCTSMEALQRFFDRLTALREEGEPCAPWPGATSANQATRVKLQDRLRRAEQILDRDPSREGGV